MKKRLVKLIALMTVVSLLGACGPGEGSGQTNDSGEDKETTTKASTSESDGSNQTSDEAVKLIVWGGVPGENGPQALVDSWNDQNPDIQVEYVRFVNDDTGNVKLDTALLSGEQIDLFFTYSTSNIKKRADSGMMEPLENLNAMDFIKENIIGSGETGLTYVNDKLYAIPTNNEPYAILINQSMLEEADITIPEDWTLSQFRDIAEQLTNEVDGQKVYGANIIDGGNPFAIPRATLGGDHYYKSETESNFDHPVFEVNLTFKEMMDDAIVMPMEDVLARDLTVYAHPAFLNEEFAMFYGSVWHFRYINDLENFPHDFKVQFAPVPRPDENTDNPYQAILGNWLSVNSKSEYKDESWEFFKYWLTDGSLYLLGAGKMPVWSGADQDAIIDGILGENPEERYDIDSFKAVMFDPDIQYVVDTISTAYPQIAQIYLEENQKLLLGETKPENYISILKEKADAAIAAE